MKQWSIGDRAEEGVLVWLRSRGHTVERQPYGHWFDLLIDRKFALEVKTARPRTKGDKGKVWTFNIHRHGKLPERQPDFYLLRLEEIPFADEFCVYLLKRAPIEVMTLGITIRSLLNQQWHEEKENLDRLRRGEFEPRYSYEFLQPSTGSRGIVPTTRR